MMLSFILHDTEMSFPLFSFAILVSGEEVYSLFLPGFTKHTESISMCCNRKDGCWKLKIKILFILSQDS